MNEERIRETIDEERIKEVFSDAEFVEELLKLEEPAEVQAALKEKGVEMTENEIMQLRDILVKLANKAAEEGELSLEQLEEIAGGVIVVTVSAAAVMAAASIAGAVFIGGAIAVSGATAGLINFVTNGRW